MATLRTAPTRHRHTEQFSGILTDQYLPGPYFKREGRRDGKKPKHRKAHKQLNSRLLQQHFAKNCKQATAYKSRGAPARGIGPPLV